jgi:hypothetical protein
LTWARVEGLGVGREKKQNPSIPYRIRRDHEPPRYGSTGKIMKNNENNLITNNYKIDDK